MRRGSAGCAEPAAVPDAWCRRGGDGRGSGERPPWSVGRVAALSAIPRLSAAAAPAAPGGSVVPARPAARSAGAQGARSSPPPRDAPPRAPSLVSLFSLAEPRLSAQRSGA